MTQKRTALVTGAGRGIGRSIAQSLSAEGIHVILSARSEQQLQEVQSVIIDSGGSADILPVDLSDRQQLMDSIEKLTNQNVAILVNNAGVGSSLNPKPIVDFDEAFWDFTMALNVSAPFLLTKYLLPGMLKNGFGRIINISSINAKIPAPHAAAYIASKHAVAGLTKATALEIAGSGVTANAICPGVTATEMNDLRIEYDAKRLNQTVSDIEGKASPYGRRLTADEISPLAVFLAGNASEGINGQLINVCGGTVMA